MSGFTKKQQRIECHDSLNREDFIFCKERLSVARSFSFPIFIVYKSWNDSPQPLLLFTEKGLNVNPLPPTGISIRKPRFGETPPPLYKII